jgi:eukaryotic-like serine/threonine-protein kinase
VSALKCPACASLFQGEAKFCTKCGTRLVQVETGTFTVGSGSPPPSAPPPAPPAAAAPAAPRATEARMPSSEAPKRPSVNHANMVGQVLDGRYRIIKKLGEGGMSYVYLGHDVGADKRYAIKILSPSLSKEENAMARLRREAAVGMRLEHPNVCHIVRLGETEEGLVYVVMPYVEGEILSDRTHRTGVVSLPTTVQWVAEMSAGLHVAHELKIVHRDLKPENIMIAKRADGTEYAVVMDFGLAKERKAGAELEKLTATGIILGTPEFMSPEQLRGQPLDPRTDVYSLTLMTYEMLTGKLPFEGRTQQEMMIARLRAEPVPVRKRRPDLNIPEAVEQVLLKGMARDPAQRYQSTPEFAAALAAAAEGGTAPSSGGVLGRLFGR